MKKIILLSTALLLFVSINSFAQKSPQKEFNVSLSDTNISLVPGTSKNIDVYINRSKGYRKANVKLFVVNTLPEGVSITFKDGENPLTQQIMTITTTESAQDFSKTIILKGSTRGVNKGIMFKLDNSTNSITSN
jgi:hypothetical protein